MKHFETDLSPKLSNIFSCILCDYHTRKLSDYTKHLSTLKHKNRENETDLKQNGTDLSLKLAEKLQCICGIVFNSRTTLWRHKKKCEQTIPEVDKADKVDKVDNKVEINQDLIMELIKDNKEMKQIIMEQNKTIQEMIPKIGNVTNNTNNTNNITNNNNVNITVFLNENCKDALSMDEFIQQIKVGVSDLLFTGKNGLTNGLSNIFIENYNKLPLVKRPLWCSDKKRKRLFIKNEVWEEDKDNLKTKEAIKQLGVMQAKSTPMYAKDNPNWIKSEKTKDIYIGIIKQTTGDVNEKIDKIIDTITDNAHLNVDTREKIVNEK